MSHDTEQMTDDELNRRAAELMGWTCRTIQSCTSKHPRERKSPQDRTTPWIEREAWYFPCESLIEAPIPQPATDHGDALRLLEYVLKSDANSRVNIHMNWCGRMYCELLRFPSLEPEEWAEALADTLPLAITRACIAALEAIGNEAAE